MKPKRKQKIKWSSELAYVVGLLTTDGSLSIDKRHIIFVSKDIPLIKTFKKILCLKNKIGVRKSSYTGRKSCYHIQFSDVILYEWLRGIGLAPNKTKIMGKLKIPNKFFFDFLRGHFDGDGTCYSYWDERWPNSFMFYIKFHAASKNHILWLRSKIKCLSDIKGNLDASGKTPVYQLKYAKKESKILFSKMYYKKDLPCLKRKYKKLETILKINQTRPKLKKENKKLGRVMESVDIYA